MTVKIFFSIAAFAFTATSALAQTPKLAVVLDNNGKVVGPLVAANEVAVLSPTGPILAPFNERGFGIARVEPSFYYYTTADCSGEIYMEATYFPRIAAKYKTQLVYAGPNPEIRTIISFKKDPMSTCQPRRPLQLKTAVMISLPIRSLGFQPPFSVELR